MTDFVSQNLTTVTEEAMLVGSVASSTFTLPVDTATIILASAILSAIFAFFSIRSAREIARKNATINMIEKVEATAHYRKLYSTFSYYKRLNSFDRLYDPVEQKDKSDRQDVLDFLNHYELVAIGIEKNVLDFDIYRLWMRGPFVSHWNAAADFIQRIRWKYDDGKDSWSYYTDAFSSFQRVALRFSPDAINLNANYAAHPEQPQGPSDEPIPAPPDLDKTAISWFGGRNARKWI
ncbi:MAG: DUF4760 domain-containing protein [Pseudomonadota bacterium]